MKPRWILKKCIHDCRFPVWVMRSAKCVIRLIKQMGRIEPLLVISFILLQLCPFLCPLCSSGWPLPRVKPCSLCHLLQWSLILPDFTYPDGIHDLDDTTLRFLIKIKQLILIQLDWPSQKFDLTSKSCEAATVMEIVQLISISTKFERPHI